MELRPTRPAGAPGYPPSRRARRQTRALRGLAALAGVSAALCLGGCGPRLADQPVPLPGTPPEPALPEGEVDDGGPAAPTDDEAAASHGTPYGAGGYRFRVVPPGGQVSTGFERLEFDDSSWDVADEAGVGSGQGCPIVGDGRWTLGTELMVRHALRLPAGLAGVQVGIAIDNDVLGVYWDGAQIHGELQHEGCAERDSLVVDVPPSLLRPGERSLLAVHLRDRGVVAYYDHRLTVTAPGQ